MKRHPLALQVISAFFLVASLCTGQIVVKDHATGTVLTSPLLLPDAPVGDSENEVLDVVNSGTAAITIQSAAITGTFFSLCCQSAFTLQPGAAQTLTLTFAPTTSGNYTGALWIDSLSIFLFARALPAASLFIQTSSGLQQAHSGTPLILTLDSSFSGQLPCVLKNNTPAAITVQSISASGGWSLTAVPALPLILQPGGAANMQLVRAVAASQTQFEGIVSIDQWNYAIEAHPPLPNVHLQVASTVLASAQQSALSISFDKPPSSALTGTVAMTFIADGGFDLTDPGILFPSTGNTTATFASVVGQTAAFFNGSGSLNFQTGTTAGTLHFHAAWGFSEDDLDIHLAAAPIGIDTVAASRESNALDITVTAFDNTRTAGQLSFSFYDSQGAFIGNPVLADMTVAFNDYFQQTSYDLGGMFKMTAHFPVTGDPSQVASVKVGMINSAGDAQSAVTHFQ